MYLYPAVWTVCLYVSQLVYPYIHIDYMVINVLFGVLGKIFDLLASAYNIHNTNI